VASANPQALAPDTVVAWTGSNKRIRRQRGSIHLYRTTWDNPQPDQEVASIDVFSTRTATGPFLIAVTIGP
jgi:hypothetical protein